LFISKAVAQYCYQQQSTAASTLDQRQTYIAAATWGWGNQTCL